MLHLILGSAGSGKSTRLTEYIAADVAAGKRTWLIIPEQQANLSERTILPRLPASAGLTFTIAGFSRLAAEVSDRWGGGQPARIPAGLSSLLMWQALRTAKPQLREYGAVSHRSDIKLTDMLLNTVDELRANAITPSALLQATEQLPESAALRPKLADLALLYESYDHLLTETLNGGSSDELAHLDELLAAHPHFAGGHVYIDSFSDFTAEEYAILRHILHQAEQVTLTLCCTDEHTADPSLAGVAETLRRIIRLCARDHIEVQREVLTENHRAATDELQLLARHLWDFSLKAGELPVPNETGSVTLLSSANIYAESEAVALHILDLVHHGTRYGDIAVVFRDSETYRGVLDAALERHDIPYFFSEKTTLTEKPLSRLLLSALRAVAHGWQSQDIMTMLKTGLCPVDAAEIDQFEQYITTWSINGAAFTAPVWTRNPDGYTNQISPRGKTILAAADHVREVMMTPLLRLHAAVAHGGKLPALAAALYNFMQEFGVAERCAALASGELSAGYLKQAGETVRVYDTVCTALTGISARLPNLVLDIEEFCTVLRMIFDATEIASVPSLYDSVTIGSADTLRVENIEVSFVLGLCEGEFPAAVKDTGLLTSNEKEQLRPLGLCPDGLQENRAANELLYVHRAMTKPSRRLFVSTVSADTQNQKKSPSLPYHRLLFLFPYLKEHIRHFDLSMIAPLDSRDPLDEPTTDTDDSGEDAVPSTETYTPIPPSPLDPSPEVMERYFGDTLYLSQSRIERFVQCPYSFYCRDLLELRETAPARIDAADSGTFIHYVFEHFLRECMKKDGGIVIPADDQIEPLTHRLVGDYLRSLDTLTLTDLRTLHIFRRLCELTVPLLRDILHELAESEFRPVALEHRLGGQDADSPYYELKLSDGHTILLGGKVDRVDAYRHDDKTYLRVVDYKTGSKKFKLDNIRRGFDLQMPLYLFGLCRSEETVPAGVLYIATDRINSDPAPLRSGLLLDEPDILRAAGNNEGNRVDISVLTREGLQALQHEIDDMLRTIGEDMLHGRATRKPSQDACRYCPMKRSCPDAVRSFKS